MDTPKQQTPQPSQEPQEEKLEFLKREEVRTMAKDIAKVREQESKKEQERIASLREMSRRDTGLKKEAQPKKPEIVLSQHPEKKPGVTVKDSAGAPPKAPAPAKQFTPAPKQPEPPLIPRRPLKRSEKLFIRLIVGGVVVFLIFNAVAFGFWYFFQREPGPQQKSDLQRSETLTDSNDSTLQKSLTSSQEQDLEPAPEPLPEVSQEQPPAPTPTPTAVSFFEAPQQEILLGNSRELLRELEAFLSAPPALGLLNIVVKTQLGILTTEEFLEKSQITMPQTLKEKLTENTMLFSYHQDNKKRLGAVFELKDTEGVTEQLQSWEQTLEQDTASFFDIIGGKGSAYSPLFRSSIYQGTPVRFQTFSVIDFGIVYGIVDNMLLLTSSFESFQRAVDQLKEAP